MTALGQESVLSTRTLSTTNIRDGIARSKNTSLSNLTTPTKRYESASGSRPREPVQQYTSTASRDTALPTSVANSLLFELPREIRERIYKLCLTSQRSSPIEWPIHSHTRSCAKLQNQLLRTCKIVHDETAPLLYSLNPFTFHHPSDANMFVRAIASLPHAKRIIHLELHIKAPDTRLWMPYLTSTDETRSLRADFTNLRKLTIRFRSHRWQHHHPPEVNLRNWCDDSRLDELMDGLRNTFLLGNAGDASRTNDTGTENSSDFLGAACASDNLARRAAAIQAKSSISPDPPKVRILCACRVNDVHFTAITNPAAAQDRADQDGNIDMVPPPQSPSLPVAEGEVFRGFTAVDLQGSVNTLYDPDLGTGSVARTRFANKNGILIALEIHCMDPKREPIERLA